jgi:hypothetical protein
MGMGKVVDSNATGRVATTGAIGTVLPDTQLGSSPPSARPVIEPGTRMTHFALPCIGHVQGRKAFT